MICLHNQSSIAVKTGCRPSGYLLCSPEQLSRPFFVRHCWPSFFNPPFALMADLKQTSVTVADRRDSEAGPPIQSLVSPAFPRWPRILGAALNIFAFSASVSIIGVLAHSLHNYSGTRDIHFGGTAISWPKNLDLHPAYLTLAASAMSIALSLFAIVLSFHRLKVPSCSVIERVPALVTAVLLLMWIAADAMQGMSEKRPKTDLLRWACRRRESPVNVLVSYTSICDEQVIDILFQLMPSY